VQDVNATVISQYSSAPSLVQLIESMNEWIDPAADFDAFYANVWNVATAVGWGLDVWGRIVGVGRVVQVASGEITWGFDEATPASAAPFNQGAFYAGAGVTDSYVLADEPYRTLIYAKALSNISNGSMAAINQILRNLFPGRGNCYCTDGANMTMTYTFDFALTPVELAVVSQSGVLSKPAGVVSSIVT
jgi:hypothetical protein